jgi:hypothetical protein
LAAGGGGLQHGFDAGEQANGGCGVGAAGGGDDHDRIIFVQVGYVDFRRTLEDAGERVCAASALATLPGCGTLAAGLTILSRACAPTLASGAGIRAVPCP